MCGLFSQSKDTNRGSCPLIASPPQKRRGLRVIYLFCNDGVPDIAVCLSCGNHLVAGGNKVGVSALSRAVCGVKVDESTALDFDGSGARLIIIIKAVQKESGFRLGVLLNKVKETALNNELASLNIYGVNIADELAVLDNDGSSVANINCIAVVCSCSDFAVARNGQRLVVAANRQERLARSTVIPNIL